MSDLNQNSPYVDNSGTAQSINQPRAVPNYSNAGIVDPAIYYDVSPFNEDKKDYRFYCEKTGKGRAIWGAIYPLLIYFVTGFVSVFCIVMFLTASGVYHVQNLTSEVMADLMPLELVSQLFACAALIPIYCYQKNHSFPQAIYRDKKIQWKTYLLGGIGIVCVAFGIDLLTTVISIFVPLDTSSSEMLEEAILNSNVFIAFLVTAVLAPIIEEVLFRGLILEKLSHAFSAKTAIIISAVLFGIAHGNIEQGIFAGIFGIALGYAYMKTHSIIPGIIGHFVNNFTATALSTAGVNSIGQILIIAVICAIALVFLIKFVQMDKVKVLRNKKLVSKANALYMTRFNMIYGNMPNMQVPQYNPQPAHNEVLSQASTASNHSFNYPNARSDQSFYTAGQNNYSVQNNNNGDSYYHRISENQ